MAHLLVFVGGCDSSDGDGNGSDWSTSVTVTPSITEGFSPLGVTFDVDGKVALTEPAIWVFDDGTKIESVGTRSVSHTFLESGVYNVTATFGAIGSEGSIEVNARITVNRNINLIVSSFAIDTEVTPHGLETISAIIQNIGTETFVGEGLQTATKHIKVGYYLSTDDNITIDDIFIGDTSIYVGTDLTQSDVPFGFQSLAPLESYQYDHQLFVKGNVPSGTYYAGAIVDYIDEFHWYDFPRSTDTFEYLFPNYFVVPESDEEDNVRLLPAHQVTVTAPACLDDLFEPDNSATAATPIAVGQTQTGNLCHDNSDWLQFDATQGNVYKITTFLLGTEADTQLILYDTDGSSILLFHDNIGDEETVDLDSGFPDNPASEIVWEALETGTYFIKVRVTTCDEDIDEHCDISPDGVGLETGYSISLQ